MDKLVQNSNKEKENHVLVEVVTTSGSWPLEGFEEVPSHQKVRIFIQKATKELNIVSTENWKATVNGNEIAIDNSYIENNLFGEITIDYGPVAGGGGLER